MKPLTAASEIDAWCTKCRLDLSHRIVALVMGVPKRVVCQTCGSEHNYYRPRAEPKGKGSARSPGAPRQSAAQRVTARAQAEADRVRAWESKIAGQANDAFARYTIERHFGSGALVMHSKFGEGYVVEVLDGDKVNIMFRDGPRTLAHGRA